MLKDSVAQDQLHAKIARHRAQVERLREERARLPIGSLEWTWTDEALFEARCALRNAERALRMAGRRWECERCGASYGPEWVAAWGLRCDVECDGWLEEVGHA